MLKNKTKATTQKLAFGNKNFYYFLLVLLFLFSNKVSSATIYFNNIYKATGTSYGFNTQSLTNINLISGTGFKFTSADPTATIFNAGNDEDGILSYTNSSGVLISIYGSISRQSKTGNTSLAVNFIPTDSTYTTPTGEAYLLVIPSKEGSFSNGTNASTSSDPIDPVLNALLNSQASSPIISISNVSVLENSGYAVFTVSLSNAANANITFTPSLTNVTAISGIDYTNSMQYYNGTTWVNITSTVSIAQNSTSLQIRVPIINYNTSATNKTFNLNTGAITGGNVINNYGTYGIGTILVPVISKSGSLTAFTSCSGSVSAEQSFSVSGVNLVSDITVTAPTGYEVSLTSGSSFAGFVTLTPSSNTVNSTAIYVRLKNNASNSASGNIVCSATNATSVNVSTGSATVNTLPAAPVGTNGSSANAGTVSISGSANSGETIDWYANSTGGSPLSGGTGTANFTTPSISSTTIYYAQARNTTTGCVSATRTAVTASITANATPTITTSGILNPFSSCSGSVSSEQSFTVSGIDLAADIVVTAPAGYEISLTSGGTFLSSITLTQVSSTVGATTIYVRLKSNASNGASGNISCTSTNATTQDVATGTATVNNPPSVTTNAINFDGINDYVLSNVSGTALTTFSIEMYVKPLSNQNARGIFQWADQTSSGIPMVLFQQTGSTLRVFVDSNYNLTTTILIGSWSHIALTYDGTIYKLYVNGALVNSYTGGIQFQNLATKLFYGNGYNGYWNGSMDEARVWSTARTQAEIQQFMNSELVGTESGLLSYFKFNQGTANENNTSLSTVTDSSSNNVSGNFNNMALTGTSSNFVTGIITNNSISAMNQNLCVNGSATALTSSLSGGSGLTYQWYSNSTSSNTGGTLIANATSSSFTPPTNQIGTTYYYVVVTNSSGCESPSTVSGAISVNAVPTIALSSSSNNVTYSANSQTTTISYSGSTGNPTTYSISWNANPSNSFAAVANANLSSSPITIDVPAGTNNGTYTGTLTVTNASNCTSSNSSFTVIVNNGDVTAPTITYPTSQNNSSSLKISENTSSVTTFTANEQVTWSITGGSERTLFSINSSGVLTFNSAPTFANPSDSSPTNSYIVEVTATDSSGNFSRQMLTVFISPLCGNWNN